MTIKLISKTLLTSEMLGWNELKPRIEIRLYCGNCNFAEISYLQNNPSVLKIEYYQNLKYVFDGEETVWLLKLKEEDRSIIKWVGPIRDGYCDIIYYADFNLKKNKFISILKIAENSQNGFYKKEMHKPIPDLKAVVEFILEQMRRN